ncbi:MAG: hypothetical protein WAU39_10075 [Polyangiales bacterium]
MSIRLRPELQNGGVAPLSDIGNLRDRTRGECVLVDAMGISLATAVKLPAPDVSG